ncbi:transposase [Duganella sp. HH105]|nr:transposase [Duganella sp. HH105]
MAKYSEQFKLAVVQQYLEGAGGYQAVANGHQVKRTAVRRWVDLFKAHGKAGLAKKFSHYDAQFRLAVLKHMWANELSYRQVANVFNIRSTGCIGQWERCYHSGGIDALTPRKRGKPKKMPDFQTSQPQLPADDETRTREELLAEVNHLRMENAYLKKLRALVQSQKQQRATLRKKRK